MGLPLKKMLFKQITKWDKPQSIASPCFTCRTTTYPLWKYQIAPDTFAFPGLGVGLFSVFFLFVLGRVSTKSPGKVTLPTSILPSSPCPGRVYVGNTWRFGTKGKFFPNVQWFSCLPNYLVFQTYFFQVGRCWIFRGYKVGPLLIINGVMGPP